MIISKYEKEWVKQKYPELTFSIKDGQVVLSGAFNFKSGYSLSKNLYYSSIKGDEPSDVKIIQDSYEIEIIVNENQYPVIREVGGRLKKFAKKNNLELPSVHIYETSELCSVGPLDEKSNHTIPALLQGPVLQFFYDHSALESGIDRPRGEYSHGIIGLLENYYVHSMMGVNSTEECLKILKTKKEWEVIDSILKRKTPPKGHWPCFCENGSYSNSFRKCHIEFFKGIWILYNNVNKDK